MRRLRRVRIRRHRYRYKRRSDHLFPMPTRAKSSLLTRGPFLTGQHRRSRGRYVRPLVTTRRRVVSTVHNLTINGADERRRTSSVTRMRREGTCSRGQSRFTQLRNGLTNTSNKRTHRRRRTRQRNRRVRQTQKNRRRHPHERVIANGLVWYANNRRIRPGPGHRRGHRHRTRCQGTSVYRGPPIAQLLQRHYLDSLLNLQHLQFTRKFPFVANPEATCTRTSEVQRCIRGHTGARERADQRLYNGDRFT